MPSVLSREGFGSPFPFPLLLVNREVERFVCTHELFRFQLQTAEVESHPRWDSKLRNLASCEEAPILKESIVCKSMSNLLLCKYNTWFMCWKGYSCLKVDALVRS